jgi:hypothetical protein
MASRIRVAPGIQSTHDVSFNDSVRIYGAFLDGGPRGLVEGASVASSLLANRQGARFGNNDPTFSHVEQRTWMGGRGQESISDDPSKFFDASCWTMSPNVMLPPLLPRWAQKLRGTCYSQMPGDVTWKPLWGTTVRLARKVSCTTAEGVSAKKVYIITRKVGSPGDLKVGLYADSGGSPDFATCHKSDTITSQSITDTASFIGEFEWSAAYTMSNATDYWIVVSQSTGTPDGKHHWEIGYDDESAGKAWNGSAWVAYDGLGIYYRLTDTDTARTWLPFVLLGQHYFISVNDARTASVIYQVGDRGLVAAGSTTTAIECTGKSWTTNQWVGARARIVYGPGKGQTAEITANDADTLTLGSGLTVTPTTASHFVIYQTPYLTAVTPGTIGNVKSVTVLNDIAFFACGVESGDTAIQQFRYDVSDAGHDIDVDTASKADIVYTGYYNSEPVLWRAINGDTTKTVGVGRASPPAAYGDDLSFGTTIKCGDTSWVITNLRTDPNGVLLVFKEDGMGKIENDKYTPLNVGLDRIAELGNGRAVAVQDNYIYMSWSHSVERLSGGTLDDEGPWQGAGMPQNRAGNIAWLEPIVAHMLEVVDAGSAGYSSVLANNGMGFHEVYRAHNLGHRCRMTHWQTCPDGRHYLWIDVGGDLVYLVFPKDTLNPMRDSSCEYMWEGYYVSSTSDLDVALLPKFFKALSVVSENLGSSNGLRRVAIDYQLDADVNTTNWIELGSCAYSPEDSLEMNQGNKRQIRWRARLTTEDADSPARVRAMVLSGYARIPPKRVWTMRIKLSTLARDSLGAPNVDPTEFYKWLWTSSGQAGGIFMRTKWENADKVWVVIEPPGLVRTMVNVMQKWWGGTATLTVREA